MSGCLVPGGLRRKGATVRVAYVTAPVTGGLCPGAFAQGAFGMGRMSRGF